MSFPSFQAGNIIVCLSMSDFLSVCLPLSLPVSYSNIMDYRNFNPFSLTQSWASRRDSLSSSKLPPSSTFRTQSQVTEVIAPPSSSQHPREKSICCTYPSPLPSETVIKCSTCLTEHTVFLSTPTGPVLNVQDDIVPSPQFCAGISATSAVWPYHLLTLELWRGTWGS